MLPAMRNPLLPFALTVFAICAVCGAAAADEPMRCGKWVVTSEATVEELLGKCGAPAAKDISTHDVYAAGPLPGRTRKVGVTTTERWTYDRGPQSFRMTVAIVDGKISSIERAE